MFSLTEHRGLSAVNEKINTQIKKRINQNGGYLVIPILINNELYEKRRANQTELTITSLNYVKGQIINLDLSHDEGQCLPQKPRDLSKSCNFLRNVNLMTKELASVGSKCQLHTKNITFLNRHGTPSLQHKMLP